MQPKITIVSPAYPYRGGIADFTEMLYAYLSRFADVNLINFKRLYPDFLFPGKTQFSTDTKKDIRSEQAIDTLNPFTWSSTGEKISKAASDFLVFAYWHSFFAPAYGVIAKSVKKNNKTKIVALCHNVLPHERSLIDIPLAKFFFKRVDYAVTLSGKVVNDLQKVNDKIKHKVLFHPIYSKFGKPVDKNEARKTLGLEPDEKVLLFFGLVRKYKGLDILLKSAAILRKHTDFKLLVVGEFYDNKEEYLKIVKDLGLENTVVFYDKFIPEDEVKIYFSAADAVILPYRSATQSGIVQIATNFGKPVIATDTGGLRETISDGINGYIVKPKNPQAIADAIVKFYAENNEEKFSANIQREVEKYSWDKFAKEFLDFLSEE